MKEEMCCDGAGCDCGIFTACELHPSDNCLSPSRLGRRLRQTLRGNRKRPQQNTPEQSRKTLQSNLQRLLPVRALPVQASARFLVKRRRTLRCAIGRTVDCRSGVSILLGAFGRLGPVASSGYAMALRIFRRLTTTIALTRNFPAAWLAFMTTPAPAT